MARRKAREKSSLRRISETFLKFAEPLLSPLGAEASQAEMEQALKIAFTVWNAVVFDAARGNSHFVEQLRSHTDHDPTVRAVVERMIARKPRLFGDDHRLIGEYNLLRHNGEWRLRAEARRPTQRDEAAKSVGWPDAAAMNDHVPSCPTISLPPWRRFRAR